MSTHDKHTHVLHFSMSACVCVYCISTESPASASSPRFPPPLVLLVVVLLLALMHYDRFYTGDVCVVLGFTPSDAHRRVPVHKFCTVNCVERMTVAYSETHARERNRVCVCVHIRVLSVMCVTRTHRVMYVLRCVWEVRSTHTHEHIQQHVVV